MKNSSKKPHPFVTRLAYGCGDASCNIVVGIISTVLTLFYTDYVGVSPAVVGIILLISRFLDGIATFVMGFIAQNTNTKYGKYRPWILWMSLPYAVSVVLLFTVPATTDFLQAIYIFITYNLCSTIFYTALNVPYGSLAYVMTRNPMERELQSTVRMFLASGGRLAAVCGTLPLVKALGDDQATWIRASLFLAAAAFLLLLFCFAKCRETVVLPASETNTHSGFFSSVKTVLKNRYFWAGASFQAMQYVLFAVTGTILPYYCKYIFHNDSWLYTALYLLETLLLMAGMLFSPLLIRRFGRRNVSLAGILIAAAGQVLFLFQPYSLPFLIISCSARGIGFAPVNSVLFAFLGEAVEFGHWRSGIRQESLMYATSTTFTKISAGIVSALMTGLLSLAGYVSSSGAAAAQPASALSMIVNLYRFAPLLILGIVFVTLFFYRLDQQLPIIMKELKEREKDGIC